MSQRRADLVLDAVAGKTASNTGWARGNCPFCEMRTGKTDRSRSLGLNVLFGRWHCFRCGAGGYVDVPDDWDRPVTSEAAELERKAMEPPDGFEYAYEEPGWSTASLKPFRRYMRKRGFDDDQIGRASCRERVSSPV